MKIGQSAMTDQRLKLVRSASERLAGQFRKLFCELFSEFLRRVQTGADRRAALGERINVAESGDCPVAAKFKRRAISGEFLTQCQRRGVLRVGSTDFDDSRKLLLLFTQCRDEPVDCRQQAPVRFSDRGDMYGGRERVIR